MPALEALCFCFFSHQDSCQHQAHANADSTQLKLQNTQEKTQNKSTKHERRPKAYNPFVTSVFCSHGSLCNYGLRILFWSGKTPGKKLGYVSDVLNAYFGATLQARADFAGLLYTLWAAGMTWATSLLCQTWQVSPPTNSGITLIEVYFLEWIHCKGYTNLQNNTNNNRTRAATSPTWFQAMHTSDKHSWDVFNLFLLNWQTALEFFTYSAGAEASSFLWMFQSTDEGKGFSQWFHSTRYLCCTHFGWRLCLTTTLGNVFLSWRLCLAFHMRRVSFGNTLIHLGTMTRTDL